MNVLVTGGTGTVGSQVVRELSSRGATIQVLTRDPAKLQKTQGVTPVQGNLGDVETVRRIYKGVDAVFLLNQVTPTEGQEGLLSLCAMREARVKRVVYLSVHYADAAAWLPHFGVKVGIEEGVRRSGIPFTILRPNNFFQNDYWFKDAILKHSVYPQPMGSIGLSRVDVRDIAEAAAVALTSSGHEGQSYDLVGSEVWTGSKTAEAWSRALGRPIAYGGDDLEAWEKQSLQYMPDWAVFDFKHMYAFFQEKGLKASPEAQERQARLLGHEPRSYGAFVAETAAAWS
jgi:uncharacterized protein YbjT (DUF2867 family)